MTVSKHQGRWRWDFWKSGVRHRKSGFRTKQEARAAETEARKNLLKTNMAFISLCERRLEDLEARRSRNHTQENQSLFNSLILEWEGKRIITRHDVEDYLRKVAKGSTHLANRRLRFLKALWNFGIKHELVSENPASYIDLYPVKKKRRYVPPIEDVKKVFAIATEEQRLYLTTILHTVGRVGAVNKLKWEDVYSNHLILRTRKARNSDVKEITVPINKVLAETLAAIPHDGEYVFINPLTGKPYYYRSKFLKTLCRKAGVKYFTYHCLRHLGASVLDKENVPLTAIQEVLGHERPSTTDGYLRSLGEGKKDAVKKLETLR